MIEISFGMIFYHVHDKLSHLWSNFTVPLYNEELTFGILFGFHELGVRVPEDVSVLCFDGTHRRVQVWPELTSIGGQPMLQGRYLAETLINMIEGKEFHHIRRVPSKILEGGSVLDLNDGKS